MELKLIKNTDMSNRMQMAYQIARVVYATSGAQTLPLVEAFTSMIKNRAEKSATTITDVIEDKLLFPVLDCAHPNHNLLSVPADNRALQMCLRTALRMLNDNLPDSCYGATTYHYADTLPEWAFSRGYIADIENVLFYL